MWRSEDLGVIPRMINITATNLTVIVNAYLYYDESTSLSRFQSKKIPTISLEFYQCRLFGRGKGTGHVFFQAWYSIYIYVFAQNSAIGNFSSFHFAVPRTKKNIFSFTSKNVTFYAMDQIFFLYTTYTKETTSYLNIMDSLFLDSGMVIMVSDSTGTDSLFVRMDSCRIALVTPVWGSSPLYRTNNMKILNLEFNNVTFDATNVPILSSDYVSDLSAKIENCSFIQNQNVNLFPLPIFSSSSRIEFLNCLILNNRYIVFFSPVYRSLSSQILFYGCLFQDNQEFQLLIPAKSILFVERSMFRDNWNDAVSMIQSYSFSGNIINSSFLSNRCTQCSILQILNSGFGNESTLNVINSQFKNSSSSSFGAFFYVQFNANLLIKGSYFENCAGIVGGCIYFMRSGKGMISNSIFSNSSAYQSHGGVIYIGPFSELILDGVIIKYCSSTNYGGGIFVDSFSKVSALNSSFLHTNSFLRGGFMYMRMNSTLVLNLSVIYNCFSEYGGFLYSENDCSIYFNQTTVNDNYAFSEGGSVFLSLNSYLSLSRSQMIRNSAKNGGAVFLSRMSSLFIENCYFSMNWAEFHGGAFYLEPSKSLFAFFSNFSANSALIGGSFFSNSSLNMNIRNCTFLKNQAIKSQGNYTCSVLSGCGGGLYLLNSSYSEIHNLILFNLFINNTAYLFGHGMGIDLKTFNSLNYENFSLFDFAKDRLVSSQVANFTIWTTKRQFYQNERLSVSAQFSDIFDREFMIDDCGFQFFFESSGFGFASAELSMQLLKLEAQDVTFLPISALNGGKYVYESNIQFDYKEAIPIFPRLNSPLNVSIWASSFYRGSLIRSNTINIELRLCSSGYVLEADVNLIYKCIPCLAGAFANFTDDGVGYCSKCPAGRYSTQISTYCAYCPIGTFSRIEGQGDSCTLCPSGTFSDREASSFCSPCTVGRYNENDGGSFCATCLSNATTFQDRSSALEKCICPSGKYGKVGIQNTCKICKDYRGIKCDANSTVPYIYPGFWRSSDDFALAYECFPSSSCVKTAFEMTTICADRYEGKRCGKCIQGSFRRSENCLECVWYSWIILLLCFLLFFGVYLYVLLSRDSIGRFSMRSVIVSIQTIGVLSRFTSRDEESGILSLILKIIDLSNLNFELLFSLECVFSSSFWKQYTGKILLILFVFPLMSLVASLVSWMKGNVKNQMSANPTQKSIYSFLMMLTTLYTFVLSTTFSAFRCYRQDDELYTLLSSPDLDCYDKEWYDNFWSIFLGIAFIVSVPIVLFFILYKNRYNFQQNRFHYKFGYLIFPYKPKFYYWEIVMILRKTVFVSLIDLTNDWPKLDSSFVLLMFLTAEWFLDAYVNPFHDKKVSVFELRSL
jgi:hypothetical protein